MHSDFLRLNGRDVIKGAAVAVFAAIVTWLYGAVSQEDFNLFTLNWGQMINVSVTALIAYLFKNFVSDDEDKIAGTL